MGHRSRDPTPDEIRERCRALQSAWTDDEWRRRNCDEDRPWMPPVCEVDEEEIVE